MNKEYRGTALRRIVGGSVTDDGNHVMLGAESVAGEEVVFLLPASEAEKLMLLSAQCAADAQRKQASHSGARTALDVARWSVGNDGATGQVVLMLTVVGGTEMTFRLPQSDAKGVVAALTAAAAEGEPPSDPSKIN